MGIFEEFNLRYFIAFIDLSFKLIFIEVRKYLKTCWPADI